MTQNEINELTAEQTRNRMTEIRSLLDQPSQDIHALLEETRNLTAHLDSLRSSAAEAEEIRRMIAQGAGSTAPNAAPFQGNTHQTRTYDASSPEYRRAFLHSLQGVPLTEEERTAYTATTTNTAAVMPTQMLNTIWDLMEEAHPILQDVTVYRTGTILEVSKRTAIAAGDAKSVAENTANDDEQNTMAKVTLSGKDFSKTVEVTYALQRMSIDAFESFISQEISDRLGAAMAADIVAQIGTDMTGGNKVKSAENNKLGFAEMCGAFAKIKRAKNLYVYANNATIYKYLVGMVDTTGRPIFQQSAQEGARGYLLGGMIRSEDAVADDKILIGDSKRVLYNMVQDVMIEQDRDIKKHVHIHSGYARGQGVLVDPDSFAEMSVTSPA